MKPAFFQIGKKLICPQKIQNLSDSLYVTLVLIVGVNNNVIQTNNDKNLKLLGQDFIDIALKADRSIE